MRGLERRVRNRKIYDQHVDGKTAKELMVLYSLSSSTIYLAIKETGEMIAPSFFTDREKVRELYPENKSVVDILYDGKDEPPKSVIESFNETMKRFFTFWGDK